MTFDRALVVPSKGGDAVWYQSGLMQIKLFGEMMGGHYSLIEVHAPQGPGAGPHTHSREEETFYILEGVLRFTVGQDAVEAGQGDLVVAPRGICHSFDIIGAGVNRFLQISSPGGDEYYFKEFGVPATSLTMPPHPGPPDLQRMATIAARYGVEVDPLPASDDPERS